MVAGDIDNNGYPDILKWRFQEYDEIDFARLISKNSRVQVITIKNEQDLRKFFKKNLISNELVLCMGAGSISKWIREMVL